ncbi:MAG: NAD(P)/FAD-dependent oxidoreductase [Clostridia bacterium]|nr:NAD(P)/FAD-dependent oxidoreductase [Clostridia bacterium]
MKVAIIGGGLAGLACAHELEKHNIKPVVYERNSYIGDQFSHVSAILEIIGRPIKDHITYMRQEFGIDIKPLNTINNLTHLSPNKKTIIKGNLGYLLNRSKDSTAVAVQILQQLKNTEIRLNELGDYESLSKNYDHVVVATGNSSFADELGCWHIWLDTYVRGATIAGNFDPNTLTAWVNRDFCKRGYAYLTPFSEKKASLILITTDVTEKEIDHYWELFLYTENLKYPIIEEFKLSHRSGSVYPNKLGNIYLAGNAGGAIDPFLGFGQYNSIFTGVMAARSIVNGESYEDLIRPIIKRNLDMLQFRKAYDLVGNKGYDLLFSAIGMPGIKHLLYYTPINAPRLGAAIFKRALKLIGKQ